MIHPALCIVDPPQEKNKLVVASGSQVYQYWRIFGSCEHGFKIMGGRKEGMKERRALELHAF
jgi:hypothetical protein